MQSDQQSRNEIKHPTLLKHEWGELFLEKFERKPMIHCYVYHWSPSAYKLFKQIWTHVLGGFKQHGENFVYAAVKPDDVKLQKFAMIYGFEFEDRYVLDNKGDLRKIMKCEV